MVSEKKKDQAVHKVSKVNMNSSNAYNMCISITGSTGLDGIAMGDTLPRSGYFALTASLFFGAAAWTQGTQRQALRGKYEGRADFNIQWGFT